MGKQNDAGSRAGTVQQRSPKRKIETERDVLLAVHDAEMTPEQAEAWAKQRGLPSFTKRPGILDLRPSKRSNLDDPPNVLLDRVSRP